MDSSLSCRQYRAPETIFGARDYNPYTVDLWSFGATIAEFFTPLRFIGDDEEEVEHDEDKSRDA